MSSNGLNDEGGRTVGGCCRVTVGDVGKVEGDVARYGGDTELPCW